MKLDAFSRQVQVFVSDLKSPKARSSRLAQVAEEGIASIRKANAAATGQAERAPQIYVDGRQGAPLASVKPDGVIVAEFALLEGTLDWIGEQLTLAAPVRSGRFARSFVLLADGQEYELTAEPTTAAEFVFTNVQPYTRKIERGFSRQAPDGIFQALAAVASKRFGNVARISFGYRSIEGAAALDAWAGATAMRRSDRSSQSDRDAWLRRQPAIIVRPF